jgi:hypothetical protein
MKANWLTFNKAQNSIVLNIGARCIWLHSPSDIHACMEPKNEGWNNGKLSFKISDQEASKIMFDWCNDGPFAMELENTLWRFPDDVREKVEKYNRQMKAA